MVYDKRAGRLMGAVISKEEFGIVNVCFNLILRLTMKSKKREAVKEVSRKGQGLCYMFFFNIFIVQEIWLFIAISLEIF